jgi:AcrR family transcriptional regulator
MDTKLHIAQVAFVLFTQNGFKATSISQLVSASGLSKGAFYHHFQSKQEVYDFVIDRFFLAYYREIDWEDYQKLDLNDFLDMMRKLYIDFVNQIKHMTNGEISKYFILFFEAYNQVEAFKPTVQRFYTNFAEILAKKIAQGKNLKPKLAKSEAIQLISKYEGLFFWLAIFPDAKIEAYLNA